MDKTWFNDKNECSVPFSKNLDQNIKRLETLFDRCDDMVQKRVELERQGGTIAIYIIYVDGMTDNDMIEGTIIRPLVWEWRNTTATGSIWEQFLQHEVETVDIQEEQQFGNAITTMLKGNTMILVDGYDKAMMVSSKRLPVRSISESESEAVMRGPRDSFNESLRTSTALVRRRIRDPRFKVEQGSVGERSKTDYALLYMEDLVQEGLVEQTKQVILQYDIDALYDSGMLEHLMDTKWYSPFPRIQSTKRPDKVAASVLEGRVAIVVDNSPEDLIVPATFNTFFQAADNYYNRWSVASFARILRYVAAIVAIGLPGFYIAITSFHAEVLPTDLLLAIAQACSSITFLVVVEVLIMELEFELLREAGIRLPGQMGNTIGVVGGLIVGQAAVDAGLVSTIVVIVVALTAIASFAIPSEAFASAFRLLKFYLIICSALFGLYGFVLGMLMVAIHLSNLTSYGVPYMMPAVSAGACDYDDAKDFILRLPIFKMRNRPIFTKKSERKRMRRQ